VPFGFYPDPVGVWNLRRLLAASARAAESSGGDSRLAKQRPSMCMAAFPCIDSQPDA
jgi:hypothetical protein